MVHPVCTCPSLNQGPRRDERGDLEAEVDDDDDDDDDDKPSSEQPSRSPIAKSTPVTRLPMPTMTIEVIRMMRRRRA